MLLVQIADLFRAQAEGLQLADLITQQVQPSGAVGPLGLDPAQQSLAIAVGAVEVGNALGKRHMVPIGVQQVALGRRPQ